MYGIFGWETPKFTIMYGEDIRLWPALLLIHVHESLVEVLGYIVHDIFSVNGSGQKQPNAPCTMRCCLCMHR